MSAFTEAFSELLDAQEEATGVRQKVTIGTTVVDAVVSEMTFDAIIAYGGKAESGGFVLQVLKAALSSAPAKLDTVSIKVGTATTTLKLQSLVENNGIYHITAFDPVAQE